MNAYRWLRAVAGLDGAVDRRTYLVSGLALAAFKYAVEAGVIFAFTGATLTPLLFVSPSLSVRADLLRGGPEWLGWALFVWSQPFIWIALSMSVRRAAAAGIDPWLGVTVLLPLVNLITIAALAWLPDGPAAAGPSQPQPASSPAKQRRKGFVHSLLSWGETRKGGGALGSPFAASHAGGLDPQPARPRGLADATVLRAAAAALGVGFATFLIGVYAFATYGAILFFGTPLVMGMVAGFIANRPTPRSTAATMGVGVLVMVLAGGMLLAFAFEGLICLFMAAPLVMPLAIAGAILGRWIAEATTAGLGHGLPVMLALPLLAGAESLATRPDEHEVLTVVEVNAPPEVVWRHVVAFPDLPEPTEWFFRCGIACPCRARIEGTGVGAIRHCEFTTGDFVEPITVWDEPHRLAFDVTTQPDPMVELSPWRHVRPPHLHDRSLQSRRGEFRLVDLGDGRTRLEGRTWYTFAMHPQAYWTLWSHASIRAIHRRVLEHVRRLAEEDG